MPYKETDKIKLVVIVILIAVLLMLFVRVYVSKYMGYPASNYWGAAFFTASFAFTYFILDALKETSGVKNFFQKKYYFGVSGIFGVFVALPLMFFLVKVLVGNIFMTPEKEFKLASSVFVGAVSEVSLGESNGLPFDVVKFNPEKILKGTEFAASDAKTGLTKPDGCDFQPNAGEYYLVYIRRNMLGLHSISCTGIKKLDGPDFNFEEYMRSKNAVD